MYILNKYLWESQPFKKEIIFLDRPRYYDSKVIDLPGKIYSYIKVDLKFNIINNRKIKWNGCKK